jgi:hypothetical protein
VEEPTIPKSKKGTAGLEFNKEHARFFDGKGIIHREFVPPNTMVNSDFYFDVLEGLREICDKKDWNFGATATGFFITTTRPPTYP